MLQGSGKLAGKALSFLASEVREMLPPTLSCLVFFNLLVLTVALLSDGHVVSVVSHASACLGALLVGKAFLLADKFPWIERHAKKPLLVATAWSVLIYYAIATALHLAERLISAATDSRGFLFRAREDAAQFDLTLFLVIQLWLALFLFVYAAGSLILTRRDGGRAP